MGGSVYLCSLDISQTCGGRRGAKHTKPWRETNRMPGVRIATAKKLKHASVKSVPANLLLCLCACKIAENDGVNAKEKRKGKNPDLHYVI